MTPANPGRQDARRWAHVFRRHDHRQRGKHDRFPQLIEPGQEWIVSWDRLTAHHLLF